MPKQKDPSEPKKPKRRRRTQIVVGHTADAQGNRVPIKKYPSATSLDKLGEKKKELRRIHGAGGPGAMADIMVADYARKWLKGKAASITPNSLIAYESYFDQYIIPSIGHIQVQSVLPSDIMVMLAGLSDAAINTRKAVLSRCKSMFGQAQDDHIRTDNPCARIFIKKDTEEKRRALSETEKAATLQYIKEHPGTDAAKLLAFSYYTSCRRGEFMGPQWKHVDLKKRRIKICQQLIYAPGGMGIITPRLKTKNSYRTLPIPQPLLELLSALPGTPDTYVFQIGGRHYKPREVELLWNSIVEDCPALSEITPHYYRHNYATMLYKAGVKVKEAAKLMGETVRVMLEVYAHIAEELNEETSDKVYDIFTDVAQTLPNVPREKTTI